MSTLPVVIIGAGLAGLHAAQRLTAAEVPFVVLEARERTGGRILSVNDDGGGADDGFDLGPSWFWPRTQPAIGEVVDSLRLSSFPQFSTGDVLFERMSREGPQRYRSGDQEPLSFRISGGTAVLVRALMEQLPADRVHLGVRVSAMVLTEHGVSLTLVDGVGAARTMLASHVIAALPPRLLEHTVSFSPAVDDALASRWRATPTWMAPHAKFFALYDRAFWREAGLSGTAQSMVGPLPEIHDATTASGKAALFGFVGVSADQRRQLGQDALAHACVDQLVRLFGPEAQYPRATLVKDWAADPLTATPLDRVPGGHPVVTNEPWVTGAWSTRLTLGGSEVSATEPGYLAGAVVAGAAAAARVIAGRDDAPSHP